MHPGRDQQSDDDRGFDSVQPGSSSGRDDCSLWRNRRGQDYVLGFALILTIVVLGAMGTFFFGADLLTSVSEDQDESVAVSATGELKTELDQITQNSAPAREISADATNARLGYGGTADLSVEVSSPSANVNLDLDYTTTILRYTLSERDIAFAYGFGMVAREGESGGDPVIEHQPQFDNTTTQTRLVVPTIQQASASSDQIGFGEDSTLVVNAESTSRETVQRRGMSDDGSPTEFTGQIRLTFQSGVTDPPTEAWAEYLTQRNFERISQLDTDSDGVDDTVQAEFETEQLFIRAATIDIALNDRR